MPPPTHTHKLVGNLCVRIFGGTSGDFSHTSLLRLGVLVDMATGKVEREVPTRFEKKKKKRE